MLHQRLALVSATAIASTSVSVAAAVPAAFSAAALTSAALDAVCSCSSALAPFTTITLFAAAALAATTLTPPDAPRFASASCSAPPLATDPRQ